MVAIQAAYVDLFSLPFARRLRVYWSCYWRAVVFIVAQIMIILPLYWFLMFGAATWLPASARTEMALIVGYAFIQVSSITLGFWLVALYVRRIIGRPFAGIRFALVADVSPSSDVHAPRPTPVGGGVVGDATRFGGDVGAQSASG